MITIDNQNITRTGYEIRSADFALIDWRERLIDEREGLRVDAITLAKATVLAGRTCFIVRCADQAWLQGFGNRLSALRNRWNEMMRPGQPRAAA